MVHALRLRPDAVLAEIVPRRTIRTWMSTISDDARGTWFPGARTHNTRVIFFFLGGGGRGGESMQDTTYYSQPIAPGAGARDTSYS